MQSISLRFSQAVIKARPATAKGNFEHFFKARFLYIYKVNNYTTC